MYLPVPCYEKDCIYHSEGICTLEKASIKEKKCVNANCLYYKTADNNITNSKNQPQNY